MCKNCSFQLKAKFHKFKIGSINALAIYDYDEMVKKLIYQYKGCYDFELKDVFLYRYKFYLKSIYKKYVVVPVPSSEIDDLKRGFNHVDEIYRTLNLEMYYCLKKTSRDKQSNKSSKNRLKIDKLFIGENIEYLYGKKVLLVDDIYTTGSTISKCLEILKKAHPKKIEVLLIAKTTDLKSRTQNEY